LLEVETTFSDRVKTYWTPIGQLQGNEHTATDATARGATCVGRGRIPLHKLLAGPNKPQQAIWQLFGRAKEGGRHAAVGTVALETAWLPACARAV
jgi:hypothetical protein